MSFNYNDMLDSVTKVYYKNIFGAGIIKLFFLINLFYFFFIICKAQSPRISSFAYRDTHKTP